VPGGRRKPRIQELHNLCASQYIIRVIKSKTMRERERGEMHTKFWSDNVKGRDHSLRPRCRWEDNIKNGP
jgi:hypothetical protein